MAEPGSAGTTIEPLHSSDEYSTSDDEINPKSIFDVNKRGHIPGHYKKSKDSNMAEEKAGKDLDVDTGVTEEETDKVEAAISDKTDDTTDSNVIVEKRASVKSLKDIFENSMIIVPSLPMDESANSRKKSLPPPIPPKTKNSPKPTSEDNKSSPAQTSSVPKAVPRGSSMRRSNTDTGPLTNKPVPKPRTKRLSLPAMDAVPDPIIEKPLAETQENVSEDSNAGNVFVESQERSVDLVELKQAQTKEDTDTLEQAKKDKPTSTPKSVETKNDNENVDSDNVNPAIELLTGDYDYAVSDSILIGNEKNYGDYDYAVSDSICVVNDTKSEPVVTESNDKVELDIVPEEKSANVTDASDTGQAETVTSSEDKTAETETSPKDKTDDTETIPEDKTTDTETSPEDKTDYASAAVRKDVEDNDACDCVVIEDPDLDKEKSPIVIESSDTEQEDNEINPRETTPDTPEVTQDDKAETFGDVADDQDTMKADDDTVSVSGIEVAMTEAVQDGLEAGQDASEAGQVISQTGQDGLETGQVISEAGQDKSETDQDAEETDQDAKDDRESPDIEVIDESDSDESFKSIEDDDNATDVDYDDNDEEEAYSDTRQNELTEVGPTDDTDFYSMLNDSSKHGYESIDSTVLSGDISIISRQSSSASASFIIISEDPESEEKSTKENLENSKPQVMEHTVSDTEKDTDADNKLDMNRILIAEQMAEQQQTDMVTSSTTESVEMVLTNNNKPKSAQEMKVPPANVEASETEVGDVSELTDEDCRPPPIMPKSETVLESLKSMQLEEGSPEPMADSSTIHAAVGDTPPPVMSKSEAVLQSMMQTSFNERLTSSYSGPQRGAGPEAGDPFRESSSDDSLPKELEHPQAGGNFPHQHGYPAYPTLPTYPGAHQGFPPYHGTQPPKWQQAYMYDMNGKLVPVPPSMLSSAMGSGFGGFPYFPAPQNQTPYMPYQGTPPGGMPQQQYPKGSGDQVHGRLGHTQQHSDINRPDQSHSPNVACQNLQTPAGTPTDRSDSPSVAKRNLLSTQSKPTDCSQSPSVKNQRGHNRTKSEEATPRPTPSSQHPKPAKRSLRRPKVEKKADQQDTPKTSRKPFSKQDSHKAKVQEGPTEYCVQFKGISEDTTPDTLTNIIEIANNIEADSEAVELDKSQQYGWVILNTKPDLHKLKERIDLKGINGRYPTVSEVPVNTLPSRLQQPRPVPKRREQTIKKPEKTSLPPEKKDKVENVEDGDTFILFNDINPNTKEENLRNFVETATKGAIDNIIFNHARTCCVVHVEKDSSPDLGKLRNKIDRNGLEGFKPKLSTVPHPTSIAVSSVKEIRSLESLGLYFESKYSNGDTLVCDPYESEDGVCYIVEYGSYDVVERVCSKKTHQIDHVELRVSPCYQCELGVVYDANIHTVVLPDPLSVTLDELTVRFMQLDCCKDLMAQLDQRYCKATFTQSSVQLECVISPKVEGFKQLLIDWTNTSEQTVKNYIKDTVKKETVTSDEDVWSDLMEYFQKESFDKRDNIVTSPSATLYKIEIVGLEEQVNECFNLLKSKHEEIRKKLNRTSKTFNRSPLEVELLKKIKVFEKFQEQFEDVVVDYTPEGITVEAQPEDIQTMKLDLIELASSMKRKQWNHQFSRYCVEFIQNKLKPKISQVFDDKRIIMAWEVDNKQFEFYVSESAERLSDGSDNDDDDDDDVCDAVIRIMKEQVVEYIVSSEMNNKDIFQSTEWSTFIERTTEQYETAAELEVVVNKVYVYGLCAEVNELKLKVEEFVQNHSVLNKSIDISPINVKFIEKHMPTFLKDLEKKYTDRKMKLSLRADKVIVHATEKGIKFAEFELNKFTQHMVSDKYDVVKVAVKEVMRDEYHQGTLDKIEKETRCIIQLPCEDTRQDDTFVHVTQADVGPHGTGQDHQDSSDVIRPDKFKATNGVTVSLIKGELHVQDGDVMVVTTAPNLKLSSGKACKSILTAGGQALQDECDEKYPNDIKFGELAVVHSHGTLECNRIYFTCLPNWNTHENPKQVLQKIMKDSLELASQHQKYSILFSAMGTGQLRYPVNIVARAMYDSVIEFDQNNANTTLKDIRFVLYQRDYGTIKAFEEEERIRIDGDGSRPTYEYQTGPLKIEVVVEDIAQQQVDALFLTTSKKMDLRHGACQAILKAGGKSLEDECASKYNNELDDGQVVEIGAGKLPCKCVFLTVLPGYRDDSVNELKKVMDTMLQLCESKGVTSIAMPALGTGNLKYPKQDVCDAMFGQITGWIKSKPNSCLKNVRFVMHAKDHEVIKIFQSYVRTAQGRGQRRGRDSRTLPRPSAGPSSSQPSGSRYNATSNTFTFRKVKLSVSIGDLLAENTDAIVNSVNDDLNLIGGVSQALAKRCPAVVEECKKQTKIDKMKKNSVVRTKCDGLNAKCVIHVKHTEKVYQWTGHIKLCLEKANRHGYQSIAFPVLGTGQAFNQISPEAIAECMFDAVDSFESSNSSTNLRDIRLIVFSGQPQMTDVIVKKLHRKVQDAINPPQESKLTNLFKKGKKLLGLDTRPKAEIKPEDHRRRMKHTSSMTVIIYSDDKSNIEKCKTDLEAKLEEMYTKKKIDDYTDLVKTLTQEEIDSLDVPKLVNINTDKSSGIITVNGPFKEVDSAINEIKLKLLKIDRLKMEQKNAEDLCKIVQWQYEEIDTTGETKTKAYNKELNLKLEEAYRANKPNLRFESDGNTYEVDFQNLVEYDVKDREDTVRVIRKDILEEIKGALPSDWTKMPNDQNLLVAPLSSTDAKYKTIEQKFISEVKSGKLKDRVRFSFDANNLKVLKIDRVQNKTLYQQYQAKKKHMTEQKKNLPSNMPIERELWHGMKPEVIASIQNHGFNRSYSGVANGDPWFGEGVYFAGDASYSCRSWLTGSKPGTKSYIFLVQVLTGQFCKGVPKMRYLPPVDPKTPTIMYDSAVDDPANPFEFVIFNDTQAYPAYLITFTS